MLRSFRLANYRSFDHEQELLLMPSAPGDDRLVVPVTAIYGANASGKSSLLEGLRFMKQAVVQSFARWDAEGGMPRKTFRLRPEAITEPSVFSIEIVVDKVRYAYGFSIDDSVVLEEWLYSYPEKRRRVLFERKLNHIRFGTTVPRDLKPRLELLEELNRPNSLFLSACAQVRIADWMPVYRWFRSQLRMRFSSSLHRSQWIADQVAHLRVQAPNALKRLTALLRAADVGITHFDIAESEDPMHAERVRRAEREVIRWSQVLAATLSESEKEAIADRLQHAKDDLDHMVRRASELRPELKFWHGGSAEEFTLDEESAGTRSWLALLPMVLGALEDGSVVAVDEIDTSLHPLLTAELVKLFRNPDTNTSGAQLIFTTHDSSLLGTMMGAEVLPRDAIWFIEKGSDGSSTLVPLTDFKPRAGQNTERRYLGGSYGAVPVLDSEDFVNAVLDR